MKIRLILENENTNLKITNTRKSFLKWLNSQIIEFRTNRSNTTSSIYFKVFFDYIDLSGNEFEEEVRIRFANHPMGYNEGQVDIDLYSDRIYSLSELLNKISKEFNIEISGNTYKGLNKNREWDNGWKFTPIEPKRAK